MAAILMSGRTFKPEVVPEVESYTKIGHAKNCDLYHEKCDNFI